MNRQEYISNCKKLNKDLFNSHNYILSYDRDKHGRLNGVVLAFRTNGDDIKVGWSKCNTKLEAFDKHIGIQKAIQRATSFYTFDVSELPHSIKHISERIRRRARNYFKITDDVY